MMMQNYGDQCKGQVLQLSEDPDTPHMMPHTEAAQAYGDPMSLPPHGTEVFVGGVPRAAAEEEVVSFCSQVGQLHSLRLVKDPANPAQNKGFAFAVYYSQDTAKDAVEQLSGKVLPTHPSSKPVRVVLSEVKNRLFLGNVPKELTKAQLDSDIRSSVPGLENVELMQLPGTERNRGFAFVEFYNHAAAEAARKALSPPGFTLRGRSLTVTWAEPKHNGNPEQQNMSQSGPQVVKCVYVAKLPAGASNENLQEIFSRWGAIERVAIPPPKRSAHPEFAFVHFHDRSAALQAAADCQTTPLQLNGSVLEVQVAKGNPDSRPPGGPRGMPMSPGGRGGPMFPRGRSPGGYHPMEPVGVPPMSPRGMDLSRMAMVPMMLPNGQMGYILQDASAAPALAAAAPYPSPGPVASPGYGPLRGGAPGAGGAIPYGGAGYDSYSAVPTPAPYAPPGRGGYVDPHGGGRGVGVAGGRGGGRIMGPGQRYRPY